MASAKGERAAATEPDRLVAQRLAAIVESSDDAIFSKDLDGTITSWNSGAERIYGYSADEIIGRDVGVLIPAERRGEENSILERLRRGEKIEPYETVRVRADGLRIDVALTVSPIVDQDHGPIGGAVIARDITHAKRQRQAQEFLARAGVAFDASLDPMETLRAIAATAVPDLCELCVIDLLDEDGSFAGAVAAASDPALAAEVEEIRRSSPIDPEGEHPVAQVMRARRSMVWRDLTGEDAMSDVAQSDEHRRFLQRAGYSSAVVAPMRARGRTLGVLALLHLASNERYDAGDLALVDDIAARAAMAFDNARLYAERDHIAAVLQRGLVPERPAEIPGFELAVAFEAAGEGIEIGGDFFDVVQREESAIVIVGDVAGRGSEAVALTSLVRHSVRAFVLDTDGPAEILGKVNDVMLAREAASQDARFVTAVLARLERFGTEARLTVCSAGHPPALVVRRDGEIETVGQGTLLGIFPDPELMEEELVLERGDTAILYTDGLLEAGSVAQHLTVEELGARVRGSHELAPQRIVSRLRDDVFARAGNRLTDDLLVLATRFVGDGEASVGAADVVSTSVPEEP
jgi:PAS domain S-box-containing protein